MLRHSSDIDGYAIGATDGPIGAIRDFLFDDVSWLLRWFVVDTGEIFAGRKVLLPPSALGHSSDVARQFSARLTKQQVKDSPDTDTDKPISRMMETDLYDYYGWSPYWSTGFYMGGYGYAVPLSGPNGDLGAAHGEREVAADAHGDQHLRSSREVTGYHIHASDGEIGHVTDFLVEDGDWSIHYLVIDTQNWWPGKKVLISPRSIQSVDWSSRTITLNVDRDRVKNSPAYDGSKDIDRSYEFKFHAYYDGHPVTEPV
jgi:hypothetical protein